jgi:hypothetical protein
MSINVYYIYYLMDSKVLQYLNGYEGQKPTISIHIQEKHIAESS